MPGYRLSFSTMDVNANTIEDALISADRTMGEVVSPIAEHGEMLGHDWFVSIPSNQFIVRFAAPDDRMATAIANAALSNVSKPIDGERLERRSRSYVAV